MAARIYPKYGHLAVRTLAIGCVRAQETDIKYLKPPTGRGLSPLRSKK